MLAPSRTDAPAPFLAWLERMDRDGRLFLSVVTVHEIERGVAPLERNGASAKAAALKAWLAGLLATYGDNILGLDAPVASLSGRLEAKGLAGGVDSGMADAIVAGIAQAHDLVVVTCNAKHFLPFGVSLATPDDITAKS